MSIHWQLTPDPTKPEAAEAYQWPQTTTLVDRMRGGFFKVSHLLFFFEYAVGHAIGNPDRMSQEEVLELSQGLTRLFQAARGMGDNDKLDYPAPLEEFSVTYAELRDLEATFRFAAEHGMVLEAY